jgi:hypothetical protein
MDLQPYVETVRQELHVAAQAGGEDAARLADRLTAPLESAIRLVVLEALAAATEEITRELAPGSVEVRLRGRDPEFVVTTPTEAIGQETIPPNDQNGDEQGDQDGGTWRVTLRLPERLRPKVETAARRDGISLNAWLVRATAAGVEPSRRRTGSSRHITGWVR